MINQPVGKYCLCERSRPKTKEQDEFGHGRSPLRGPSPRDTGRYMNPAQSLREAPKCRYCYLRSLGNSQLLCG